jgi:hypothetical protein
MQRALNQSYAERDKLASDVDKLRDDLERSQVKTFFLFFYLTLRRDIQQRSGTLQRDMEIIGMSK